MALHRTKAGRSRRSLSPSSGLVASRRPKRRNALRLLRPTALLRWY